jgi:SUKH superfamily protein
MTAFERLCAAVPPQEHRFGAEGDWGRTEADLRLAFPSDYKTFVATYGSGKICEFVSVLTPFIHNPKWSLLPYVHATVLAYQSYVETKVVRSLPYPLYPEKGGLLPFGTTENSNCLNWLTQGRPDQWELVVWEPDFLQFFKTGYKSLTEFMADLVQQKCGLIPDDAPLDWFNPPRSFTAINYDSPEWSNS